jgi:predicted ArsR family transcriptional regulator
VDLQALLAPDTDTPLGPSRARVLDLLRAAGAPLDVRDVAGRTGLHSNTARFHLRALTDAGLVTEASRNHAAPGRPSMTYRAAGGSGPAAQRQYRLLAEMLASLIAGVMPEPGETAAAAGREWGRYLTDQPAPYQRTDVAGAIGRLTATLADIGFAPEAVADGRQHQLRLRQCPFREVAERHQDVVCQLHLGLMRGVLDQLRAPLTADRLQPFAEPGLCIAYLTAGPAAAAGLRIQ